MGTHACSWESYRQRLWSVGAAMKRLLFLRGDAQPATLIRNLQQMPCSSCLLLARKCETPKQPDSQTLGLQDGHWFSDAPDLCTGGEFESLQEVIEGL